MAQSVNSDLKTLGKEEATTMEGEAENNQEPVA